MGLCNNSSNVNKQKVNTMNHDTLNLKDLHIPYNETTEFGDYTIKVEYDDISDCPRGWDNLGTMVCFHSRYTLGDKHDFESPDAMVHELSGLYEEEIYEYLTGEQLDHCWKEVHKKYVVLPLYLYDHSGITMNTTGFTCGWDSGCVGYIYISHEDIRKEYNIKRVSKQWREKVASYLTSEVEIYDQYLTGEVYWFNVEKTDNGESIDVDSCGGFYGYNDEYMISVIKDAIQHDIGETPQQTEMF